MDGQPTNPMICAESVEELLVEETPSEINNDPMIVQTENSDVEMKILIGDLHKKMDMVIEYVQKITKILEQND